MVNEMLHGIGLIFGAILCAVVLWVGYDCVLKDGDFKEETLSLKCLGILVTILVVIVMISLLYGGITKCLP